MAESDLSKRSITDEEFSAELARRVSKAAGNDHEFLKYVVENCADEAIKTALDRWKLWGIISLIISTGLGVWLWKWAEAKIDQNKIALTEFQTNLTTLTKSVRDAQKELERASALQSNTEKVFDRVNGYLERSVRDLETNQAKLSSAIEFNRTWFNTASNLSFDASNKSAQAAVEFTNALAAARMASNQISTVNTQANEMRTNVSTAIQEAEKTKRLAQDISQARVSELVMLIDRSTYTLHLPGVTNVKTRYDLSFYTPEVDAEMALIIRVDVDGVFKAWHTNCVSLPGENAQSGRDRWINVPSWPIDASHLKKRPPNRKVYPIPSTPFAYSSIAEYQAKKFIGKDMAFLSVFAFDTNIHALETNLDFSCCKNAP